MMIEVILLRLDAPLMSFGGVAIDHHRVTREYPGRSMLTGLLGNALGYDHRDAEQLQALQARIEYGVRCDRPGKRLRDYQTVDLSQAYMQEGWTTRGFVQRRAGAENTRLGTHIRLRDFLADAVYTIALALKPPDAETGLDRLDAALRHPARPLFFGRKSCLPTESVFLCRLQTASLRSALQEAPLSLRAEGQCFRIWLPAEGPPERGAFPVTDERDWTNQIHVGRRFIVEDSVNV